MMPLLRRLIEDDSRLTPEQRTTHTYVVGQSGTGKSRALESWALQDIEAGHGLAVIDPHGDLFHHLLAHLAARPELAERVVIVDPCDPDWVVSFNPLEAVRDMPQERLALFLTDVVVKIWNLNTTTVPRMVWLLTNSFLALADLGLTLPDLPRFLLDRDFREPLVLRLKHPSVRAYFTSEYPKPQWLAHQWATPVLNKIGALIFDPDVQPMLAKGKRLNFRQAMDDQLIVLAHLPRGILGEESSALLGAFLVAQFQKAALSRADVAERPPYYLYLDEFQTYTTDNIRDILSESRKYGLSLTLAHQYLEQLPTELRSAVLNTAGTLAYFRVGYHDAHQLAKEVFPSRGHFTQPKWEFQLRHMVRLPFITAEERQEPIGWEGLAELIANLPLREFWMRQRGMRAPVHLRTLDMPDPEITPQVEVAIGKLRAVSGSKYGRPKAEVQRQQAASHMSSPDKPTRKKRAEAAAQDGKNGKSATSWGN